MVDVPITITEAAEWLRSGRITAVALTEALLARSHAAQDTIAAFIAITDEAALAAARQADADFARRRRQRPAPGHPARRQGHHRHEGRSDHGEQPRTWTRPGASGRDATVVTKLRAAGAVITGKLGLHEYATGWPDPDTGFRIPKNPWDLDPHARRIELRDRRGRRRRPDPRRPRHRHRRLDPRPGLVLRHQRDEADVRAGQQGGLRPARVQPRPHRPDGAHGPRLRPDAPGPGRPRPRRRRPRWTCRCRTCSGRWTARWTASGSACRATTSSPCRTLDAEVKTAVEAAIARMAEAGATVVEVEPAARRRGLDGRPDHQQQRGVRLPPAGPAGADRSSTASTPAARSCSAACSAARTTSRRSGSARSSRPSARPCSAPRPTCWSCRR